MKIKLLDSRLNVPDYATAGSAAIDLHACRFIDKSPKIWGGLRKWERVQIGTGIALDMTGCKLVCGLILPRSGLGSQGVILGNSVGVIDNDYQGEIIVSLWNTGDKPFELSEGDRIAQLLFLSYYQPKFEVTTEFKPTKRGDKGFGSTGK